MSDPNSQEAVCPHKEAYVEWTYTTGDKVLVRTLCKKCFYKLPLEKKEEIGYEWFDFVEISPNIFYSRGSNKMPNTRYRGKSDPLPKEYFSDSDDSDYSLVNTPESDYSFCLNYSEEVSGWSTSSDEDTGIESESSEESKSEGSKQSESESSEESKESGSEEEEDSD